MEPHKYFVVNLRSLKHFPCPVRTTNPRSLIPVLLMPHPAYLISPVLNSARFMQQKQPNPDDAQQLSPDSQPAGSKPASGEGDIGLSSGQLMLALQLGIFLPFLGPLLAIGIGAMNRQHKDGRLIMLGGLCLILLQLATLALIWGYIASRPVQGPMN